MTEINCCTFSTTGNTKNPIMQHFRLCKTCYGDSSDKGCCLNCVSLCHDGHDLGPVTSGTIHCFCGESTTCKAMLNQDASRKSSPATVTGKRSRTAATKDSPSAPIIFTVGGRTLSNNTSLSSLGHGGGLYDDDDDEMVLFTTATHDSGSDQENKKKSKVTKKAAPKAKATPSAAPTPTPDSDATVTTTMAAPSTAESAAETTEVKPSTDKPKAEKPPAKRVGKPKKEKDAPKGPQASYMIFSNQTRELAKSQTTGMTMVEVSRLIGQKWAGMSASEKQPYEEQAREDRDRYMLEMHEYKLRKEKETAAAAIGASAAVEEAVHA